MILIFLLLSLSFIFLNPGQENEKCYLRLNYFSFASINILLRIIALTLVPIISLKDFSPPSLL